MFSLIACVGKNRELGKEGKLIFHIKEDMQFFKETTREHKVVMGRKTWESLPGKLPGRTNIVISRRDVPGADECVSDIADFIEKNKDSKEEIFIIGGGMVYFEFLKYADKLYLTEVDKEEAEADAFFPEFDKNLYDRTVIKEGKDHDLVYQMVEYTRKN
ncbi:dihydrofolate reductase [Candidatus Saccharibacteria bacterium]|nr:dihydrofolate reductase [Candidatus Saccharibacteria bacterium]